MRRSRVSQDTTKIFNALSPNRVRRSTRQAAKTISTFALGHAGSINIKSEHSRDSSSSLESAPETNFSTDIEDSLTAPKPPHKRKRGSDSPATTIASTATGPTSSRTSFSPRKRLKPDTTSKPNNDDDAATTTTTSSPNSSRATKALPKTGARKTTTLPDSTVQQIQPPPNWSTVYDMIKAQRQSNPNAPVDTMGCEDLYWRGSSPREQRYHILTALMLSSQTKDTVTAAAMQRLHTELAPQSPCPCPCPSQNETETETKERKTSKNSTLTIGNILSTSAAQLDSLIGRVGFHHTKTKHLQLTASVLADRFGGDVPRTLPELLSLPGVGPKMAFLCLSAAWGIDAGIGVDVHVHRITNRWGWHATATPEQTRRQLEAWLPRDRWHEINRLLVGLGQTVCLPVGRRCGECALAGTGLCKSEVRGWEAKEMEKRRRTKKSRGVVKVERAGGDQEMMVEMEEEVVEGKEAEMLEVKREEEVEG
ncbi:hypothetical protein GJ744_003555 [Endocarpon pusillum]|uniref:Endonuclease III homolog n=1 Tax=Endocarpon pusillum TaxID=364733 RepID=A0A8H7E628_9EURO|nr:hypothetical protein GJ744_003555 [Endocarpon pusillum]